GDISQIEKGLSYKSDELSEDEKEGEIFITLKIFQRGGGFRPEYKYYIGNRYKREHITYDGDLVIALTDMTSDARVVGAPALVILPPDKTKGILSLDAAKLMIPDHIKDYLYLCLKESQEENATFANGVNVLHLNLALFKKGKYILLPPTHILQRFHELVEPMFRKIILNQKEIMILQKARDALLPKLVFGKLRVVEI
ncbi:restriction endonuclease subunit S, partial [candidate division WOR-3 bacterium]|nr:restriction endonuclease subunit S [candidate division WOR-3 bacterium]